MARNITQEDIALLFQHQKTLFAKVELLNQNLKVVESLEGNIISDSFSCDGTSAIRRTYSIDLVITDSSFLVGKDRKIWFDKRIRPYVGYRSMRTQKIIWYQMGTYLFNSANFNYDATTKTVSIPCSDMMCILNGDRGGTLNENGFLIEAGASVRESIIKVLELAGIKRYIIGDMNREIPYDLEFNDSITYYDILQKILELYPGYEMYFDIDGIFVVKSIATEKGDVAILNDSIINRILISEETSFDFNSIKNVTEIYGRSIDIDSDRYTDTCTYQDGIYSISLERCDIIENSEKVGILIPETNSENSYIKINDFEPALIVNEDGDPVSPNLFHANEDYVFRYRKASNTFLYLGQYYVHARYELHDSSSPFSVEEIGEIVQVFSGGEYDNYYSDELALEEAKYQTFLSTNQSDTIKLKVISIPFLEANQRIDYTPINATHPQAYLVQRFSGGLTEGTMDLTLMRVYDYSIL